MYPYLHAHLFMQSGRRETNHLFGLLLSFYLGTAALMPVDVTVFSVFVIRNIDKRIRLSIYECQ